MHTDEGITLLEEARLTKGARGVYALQMRHNLLTKEEEYALGQRSFAGDITARNALVEKNLRLVVSLTRIFHNTPVPLEDLIQEGNIGLMRAATKFNPELGFRFSTYAIYWIRQAIFVALQKSPLISIPRSIQKDIRLIGKIEHRIMLQTGRIASDTEIAAETHLTMGHIRHIRGGFFIGSLDKNMPGDDAELDDYYAIIPDVNAEAKTIQPIENSNFVELALEILNNSRIPQKTRPLLREIVERAYGLNGYDAQPIPEIAHAMNIPLHRTANLLKSATHWMKKHSGHLYHP